MEILTENPFTGSYKIRIIRTYYNQDNIRKLLETGTDSKAYYEFELEKKIAVYPNEDFMDILLNEAKPITMRLYVYIMHRCIRKDEDWIDLKVKDVQAYLKTSRNNLYTAIEQLRSFRFIAPRKGRNVYWINTHLIFNGNRVEYLNKVSPDCVSIAKTTSQYL